MKELSEKLNGTLLIATDDGPVHCENFGVADHLTNTNCAMDTQYLIASITKQFTAAAILNVIDDVHRPIRYYRPDIAENVTIHHILTHSSGIKSLESPPAFPPGSQFAYCNITYVLLSDLVHQITGQPFGTYLDETFFKPLGMTSTLLATHGTVPLLQESDPRCRNLARGYTELGSEIEQYTDLEKPKGAGGIISSAADLLKWNQALHNGENKVILQQHMRTDLKNRMGTHYGYGIAIKDHTELGAVFCHHGGLNGYSSTLVYVPSLKLSLVYLSNIDNANIPKIESFLLNNSI